MRWQIGDVSITKILEMEALGGSRFVLPEATPEEIKPITWLVPDFADENGRLRMSIHALVVQTPTLKILVDPCLGNDKTGRHVPAWNGRQGRFLEDMAEAGYPREDIDIVLCTHLHTDHVGWNTMWVDGRWVPTFPNARYIFGRAEFEHWRTQDVNEVAVAVFNDSVRPVFEAGLVDLVDSDYRLCEEIRLIPTQGHTPGHMSAEILSRGQMGFITGDIAHHPCQLARPEWSSVPDCDPELARQTRRRIFSQLAGTPTLVFGTHFTGRPGHIVKDGDVFKLEV